MPETTILSVQKALNILSILAFDDIDRGGIPLKKLSEMLNQRNTTLHHILKTMIKCGYAEQNSAGHYIAGKKCIELRQLGQILPGGGIYDMIQNRLVALGEELGESLVYASLLNGRRVTLFQWEASHPIKVDFSSIESQSIYELVTGRVLAAFSDARSLSEIIERNGYPGESWGGIFDNAEFEQKLSEIRQIRHVVDTPHKDVLALAVPVKIHPLGALGFYSPQYRCNAEKQKLVLERLWEIAFRIEVFADTRA